MSDEAPAGLEEPLLETRHRPVLSGEGQDQSAQEIAEIVGVMCPLALCGRWAATTRPDVGGLRN